MAPSILGRRSKNGSPAVAIIAYSATAVLLGNLGNFNRLANIATIAVVAQYIPTCAAVLVLRWRKVPARFRIPGGPIIPIAALAGCWVFLQFVERDELLACAGVVAVGFVLRAAMVLYRRSAKVR